MSNQPLSVHCNVTNDKLTEDEWAVIQQKCLPGKASISGFIVPGEFVRDIIAHDAEIFQTTGVDPKKMAQTLKTIIKKENRHFHLIQIDKANYRNNEHVGGNFDLKVETVSYMGAQCCPFQNKSLDDRYHGYEYGDTDVTITKISTGKSITFNTLLLHMMVKHSFLESPSVRHRFKYEDAVDILQNELVAVPDPMYTDLMWDRRYYGHDMPSQNFGKYLERFAISIETNDDYTAYLMPYTLRWKHIPSTCLELTRVEESKQKRMDEERENEGYKTLRNEAEIDAEVSMESQLIQDYMKDKTIMRNENTNQHLRMVLHCKRLLPDYSQHTIHGRIVNVDNRTFLQKCKEYEMYIPTVYTYPQTYYEQKYMNK